MKKLILFALLALVALPSAGQFTATEKATLELVADRTAYEAGANARLAGVVSIAPDWHVNSYTPTEDWMIRTELSLEWPPELTPTAEPELTYPQHKQQKFEFTEGPIAVYDGTAPIFVDVTLPADAAPGTYEIQGKLHYQACDHSRCLAPTDALASLMLTIGDGGEATNAAVFSDGNGAGTETATASAPAAATSTTESQGPNLAFILLLAFVGGFILNAMPCVLPVLSIKVFGVMRAAAEGRRHVVIGNLATTAGIVVSFWLLAGAAVGAKMAGAAVGWGVQFQQPAFVTFMTVIVMLFALNMWGLFEINLPERLAMVGSSGPQEGVAGHFASGLFATLMATPCSAPFLGTAVGFALAQASSTIFLIFTAIGLGLALPYIILAIAPGAAKVFPKPGAWMNTFKGIMGFLLAATAIWLFFVLAAQVDGASVAYVQAAILGLALCIWLASQSAGALGKRLSTVGGVAAAVLAVFLAATAPPAMASGDAKTAFHQWVAFDEAEAQRLANDENRFVFVDVTADWCVTCKAIERTVLETKEVANAFDEYGVVPMKADWTNRDDKITEFLASYGKAAVPFYVLYRPGQEPHAFNEVVTKKGLLEVLSESERVASVR